jgi:hypothetical protein
MEFVAAAPVTDANQGLDRLSRLTLGEVGIAKDMVASVDERVGLAPGHLDLRSGSVVWRSFVELKVTTKSLFERKTGWQLFVRHINQRRSLASQFRCGGGDSCHDISNEVREGSHHTLHWR